MGCYPPIRKRPHMQSMFKNSQGKSCETVNKLRDLRINRSSFVFHKYGPVREDYELTPKVGTTALGSVRIGIHKITHQERVVKSVKKSSITKDENSQTKFFEEIEILRKADHPNIVKLFGIYEDSESYHIITEHLKGGDLFDFMVKYRALSESVAAHFFKELLWAVEYLHSNGLILRDLKPENLLLDKDSRFATLKVVDFGTSSLFDAEQCFFSGSAYFVAPEVIRNTYDEKCDIWSCGVILYVLLSGKPPFIGKTDDEILAKVESGHIKLKGTEWDSISEEAKSLLKLMLNRKIKKRPSAAECLHSTWMLELCANVVDPGSSQALENLKRFKNTEKLQQAVIGFISQQLITKQEKRDLIEEFQAVDQNGDGRLSRDELVTAYEAIIGKIDAEEEVENIMREVDTDGDGFIEYSEFVMATVKRETLLSKKNIETAFRAFDADGSGSISANELRELIGSEILTNDAVWRDLIEEADENGDGVIDISEFKEMMMKVI